MRRRELLLLLAGAMTSAPAPRAQQKAMPVIGILGTASPGAFGRWEIERASSGIEVAVAW